MNPRIEATKKRKGMHETSSSNASPEARNNPSTDKNVAVTVFPNLNSAGPMDKLRRVKLSSYYTEFT